MFVGNLSETDQVIARVLRGCAIMLLTGLAVTGTWQFFFHEGDPTWDRYQLGSGRYLISTASTGIAEVHAAFADLAGLLSLLAIAWVSSRVLHRVSWLAVGALLIVIWGLYTGTLIRFNTTIEDGAVVTSASGYGQFFLGQTDGAVTDRFELSPLAVAAWTVAHIISAPVLVVVASMSFKRSEARRQLRRGQHRSWLDDLPQSSPTPPASVGARPEDGHLPAPRLTKPTASPTASAAVLLVADPQSSRDMLNPRDESGPTKFWAPRRGTTRERLPIVPDEVGSDGGPAVELN